MSLSNLKKLKNLQKSLNLNGVKQYKFSAKRITLMTVIIMKFSFLGGLFLGDSPYEKQDISFLIFLFGLLISPFLTPVCCYQKLKFD